MVGTLETALTGDRVGVLLGPGLPGAVLLGMALSRRDGLRPLPVHTVTFPALDGPAAHTPAVLVSLPHGSLREWPHEFDLATVYSVGLCAGTTRAAAARRFIKVLTGEASRALRIHAGFELGTA